MIEENEVQVVAGDEDALCTCSKRLRLGGCSRRRLRFEGYGGGNMV